MSGRVARDKGAGAALKRAGEVWRELMETFVLRYYAHIYPEGACFEAARMYVEGGIKLPPPSSNAWGALALTMAASGLIEKTGEHRSSVKHSNHARSATVWRLTPLGYTHVTLPPQGQRRVVDEPKPSVQAKGSRVHRHK